MKKRQMFWIVFWIAAAFSLGMVTLAGFRFVHNYFMANNDYYREFEATCPNIRSTQAQFSIYSDVPLPCQKAF
jgi:hypothetical protein